MAKFGQGGAKKNFARFARRIGVVRVTRGVIEGPNLADFHG